MILQAGIVVTTVAIVICAHPLPVGGPARYRAWEANAKEISTFQSELESELWSTLADLLTYVLSTNQG